MLRAAFVVLLPSLLVFLASDFNLKSDKKEKHQFALEHVDDDVKQWLCEDEATFYLQKNRLPQYSSRTSFLLSEYRE